MARVEAYLRAKFHLDPSNRSATIHQRYGQTDRQRSDSIGRTVLQTVAQKLCPFSKKSENFPKFNFFGVRATSHLPKIQNWCALVPPMCGPNMVWTGEIHRVFKAKNPFSQASLCLHAILYHPKKLNERSSLMCCYTLLYINGFWFLISLLILVLWYQFHQL